MAKKINKVELKSFCFDLVGNGVHVFAGEFKAIDLGHAVDEARRCCKQSLPGYRLVDRETGNGFDAIQFFDYENKNSKGRPKKIFA